MSTYAYRCGHCGQPCDAEGVPMPAEDAPTTTGETERLHGQCCAYLADEEEDEVWIEVTREMAMDAGDPSMEGALWRWR